MKAKKPNPADYGLDTARAAEIDLRARALLTRMQAEGLTARQIDRLTRKHSAEELEARFFPEEDA